MTKYLSLIFILIVASCHQKVNSQNSSSKGYEALAYETFDIEPNVVFEQNEVGDYVLATHLVKDNIPGSEVLKVLVINIGSNEVVYQQSINNGTVEWEDEYTVKMISPPGIPNGNQATLADYTYYLDVKTGKKSQKTTSQK